MKRFALFMALVGLTFTGCAQNNVFGPMAKKGGENLRTAFAKKSKPTKNIKSQLDATSEVQLAGFCGGDSCCDCADGCCGGDSCCGQCGDGCDCGDGCSSGKCKNGCGLGNGCRRMLGCNPHAGGYPEAQNFNPGPPSGQVAYPYYTVRGPRDFLRNNPPTIGPY